MNARDLHAALEAAAPGAIVGVSIGLEGKARDDKSAWGVEFAPAATEDQRKAVRAALGAYDPKATAKPKPTMEDRLAKIETAIAALAAQRTGK